MAEQSRDQLLKMMSDSADAVATWTGLKAQFVSAGWDPGNAELMVLETFRAGNLMRANGRLETGA